MIDLSSLSYLLTLLLPVPMTVLAGALRQDKFNPIVNEAIAWFVVFSVSLLSIVLGIGGHLTGDIHLDFMTIVAYSGALMHTAPFKPLQVYLQSNFLSLGVSTAQKIEQTTIADVKASVDHLLHFLTSGSVAEQQAATQQVQQLPFPPANPAFGVMPVSPSQFQQAPQSSYPLASIGREQMPQPPKG